jgi:hypothetical protein
MALSMSPELTLFIALPAVAPSPAWALAADAPQPMIKIETGQNQSERLSTADGFFQLVIEARMRNDSTTMLKMATLSSLK